VASVVEICNRALGEIGARSSITSLDEPSAEAINCSFFYKPLLEQLLRAAPWGFARRQVSLSLLGTGALGTAQYPWAYKYAYPSDCMKFRYVIPPPTIDNSVVGVPQVGDGTIVPAWGGPSRNNRYLVATDVNEVGQMVKVLLSNVRDAIGVYTMRVENPDLFDPLFEQALVSALAAKLTMPLTGNVGMKNSFEAAAMQAIRDARATDGNEAIATTDHTPDWILARNGGVGAYGGFGDFNLGEWNCSYENPGWGM
jgi:hypothetical protein